MPESLAEILVPPASKPAAQRNKRRIVTEGRVISGDEILKELMVRRRYLITIIQHYPTFRSSAHFPFSLIGFVILSRNSNENTRFLFYFFYCHSVTSSVKTKKKWLPSFGDETE